MTSSPRTIVDSFAGLRVLVIGEPMLDTYYVGASRRLCQEAPVPRVDIHQRSDMPGGAGNCAANAAALGATVTMLGITGDDEDANLLRRLAEASGISMKYMIACANRRTLTKARILCDDHLIVRFDQGSTEAADEPSEHRIAAALEKLFPETDVVLVSDYGYGVVTPAIVERLAMLQASAPRTLVVDSKNLGAFRGVGMTACKPNYEQALQLLQLSPGTGLRRVDALAGVGDRVLEATGAKVAAVTLDYDGALVFEKGAAPHRTYARGAPAHCTAGAGDTFLATLALALAAGAPTSTGADIASTAAGVVVSKPFTAVCSAQDLKDAIGGQLASQGDLAGLQAALEEYRRHNRHIVLTNGCFDILHHGHIHYLNQAKQLGDVLIVGVNGDESIRRLKGASRPINRLADRMSVLAALSSVDHVVAFDEDTPYRLIEAIRPDVFVKGGDYTRATLPEANLVEALGGTVKILPFLSNRSTSRIIDRIRRTHGEPKNGNANGSARNDHEQHRLGKRATRPVR